MKLASVLDIPIAVADAALACDEIERRLAANTATSVLFANVHLVELAQRESMVDHALRTADLVLPDGAPIAWAAGTRTRATGSDVFDELNRRAAGRGYRVFLLGGTASILDRLRRGLTADHPELSIAGSYAPPFAEAAELDVADLVRRVEEAEADIVWVGLGAPKQELVIAAMQRRMAGGVLLGVGAVFDFASGGKRRAPEPLQRLGLEWLHRLASEPRRLWRRYLVGNTRFLVALGAASMSRRAPR